MEKKHKQNKKIIKARKPTEGELSSTFLVPASKNTSANYEIKDKLSKTGILDRNSYKPTPKENNVSTPQIRILKKNQLPSDLLNENDLNRTFSNDVEKDNTTPIRILSKPDQEPSESSNVFSIDSNESEKKKITVLQKKDIQSLSEIYGETVPMKNCIHMINDNFKIHEDYSELVEFLESKSTENTGVGRSAEPFQVIGVVGRQGVGKSTIANELLGRSSSVNDANFREEMDAAFFMPEEKRTKKRWKDVFEVGASCNMGLQHTTRNVDVFVSGGRRVVLDFPPSLSNTIMKITHKELMFNDPDYSAIQDKIYLEQLVYGQSLQYLCFALFACDVIVLVEDSLAHLAPVIQSLQAAVMQCKAMHLSSLVALKAPKTSPHWPHLVFVHNKARSDSTRQLQRMVSRHMKGCHLKYRSGMVRSQDSSLNAISLPCNKRGDFTKEIKKLQKLRWGVLGSSSSHGTEKLWFEKIMHFWKTTHNCKTFFTSSMGLLCHKEAPL